MNVSSGHLLTAQELADYLNLPVTWVWAKARERKIPCIRCGHYQRFELDEVLRALRQGQNSDVIPR